MIFNLVYALGIFTYGSLQKWIDIIFGHRPSWAVLALINTLLAIMAFLHTDILVYTVSAAALTFLTGILGGQAYYTVARDIPKYWRGRVVAGGICAGTIVHLVLAAVIFPGNEHWAQICKTGVLCAGITGSYLIINSGLSVLQQPQVGLSPHHNQSYSRKFLAVLIASVVILCYLHSLNEGILTSIMPGQY
jgi:MFS family permease